MISITQFWTVLTALASILPTVIAAVREGRIKQGAYDEALNALLALHSERIAKAKAAGEAWKPLDGHTSKWEV